MSEGTQIQVSPGQPKCVWRNSSNPLFQRTEVLYVLLAIVTLLVFFSVRSHGFVNIDDEVYVTENPHVRSGLRLENVLWAFRTGHASNWHPLTWISHMLDCQLF